MAALEAPGDAGREAAIARLTIIGSRAVDRLIDALAETRPIGMRVAALRVLEAIGDVRALAPAMKLLRTADEQVALAAASLVGSHLTSRQTKAANEALDGLTALALDTARPDALRIAALDAFDAMPADIVSTICTRLADDPSPLVRQRVLSPPARGASATLEAIAEEGLPEEPELVRSLVASDGATAPLTVLHRIVNLIRARELAETTLQRQQQWVAVRAATHKTLAVRGSRVALYDLRETIEAADAPLPVGLLAAVSAIGDVSCLEAIAAAYVHTAVPRNDWWHQHLATAFSDIVQREKITRRHTIMKRISKKWHGVLDELMDKSGREDL